MTLYTKQGVKETVMVSVKSHRCEQEKRPVDRCKICAVVLVVVVVVAAYALCSVDSLGLMDISTSVVTPFMPVSLLSCLSPLAGNGKTSSYSKSIASLPLFLSLNSTSRP